MRTTGDWRRRWQQLDDEAAGSRVAKWDREVPLWVGWTY